MDQVEEVKSKTDIVSLISEYLPLKKSGRNYQSLCPFHDEKTPSFMVSPELQIYKCFGCGAGGDAIKFLQEYEKMEFWEALKVLAKRAGVKLETRNTGQGEEKKRLYEINDLAANFYHFILTKRAEGEKARQYLADRGINNKTAKQFNLGFAPPGKNSVIEYLKKKGYSNQEISRTGLTASGSKGIYQRFHSRLVFPLYNHRESVIGFSGRVIPGVSPKNIAKYINIPNTPIYKKGANLYGLWLTKNKIREEKEAVIVEGEFDLITPYQSGIENIVAIKGTAFTADQAKLLKRYADSAVFALDADAAGSEAVRRSSGIAEKEKLEIKVAILPEGYKDPDDLAGDNPELMKKVLNKSVSVYDFVIQTALRTFDISQPNQQRKFLNQVLPFINQVDNAVVKQHYLKKIADHLNVSLDSVITEVEKIKPSVGQKRSKPADGRQEPKKEKDRRLLLEEQLLMLIFITRAWEVFDNDQAVQLISHPRLKKIIQQAKDYLGQSKSFHLKEFFKTLPEELKPGFEKLFFLDLESDFDETDIQKTIIELIREDCRSQLAEISSRIASLEKKGKEKEIKDLEQKYVEISKKLSNLDKNA